MDPFWGLFLFGMFSSFSVKDKWVPLICIVAPISTYVLSIYLKNSFNFDFGFISIAVNGLFTMIGLFIIKQNK